MTNFYWKTKIESFDKRRDIVIPGDVKETVQFCVEQFLQIAIDAIKKKGIFTVALSGGQTPHAIFKELCNPSYRNILDWSKILCFWSDERSVPPDNPENNYYSAMKAGLSNLPLLSENIYRMKAESAIEEHAIAYEKIIREKVPSLQFDLMMLGMGEDGHTASLFPRTLGLHIKDHLVIANYVPQKHTWRMSMSYECIDRSINICVYVIGSNKSSMINKIFEGAYDPDNLPAQRIGTPNRKATWILDRAAGEMLLKSIKKAKS